MDLADTRRVELRPPTWPSFGLTPFLALVTGSARRAEADPSLRPRVRSRQVWALGQPLSTRPQPSIQSPASFSHALCRRQRCNETTGKAIGNCRASHRRASVSWTLSTAVPVMATKKARPALLPPGLQLQVLDVNLIETSKRA